MHVMIVVSDQAHACENVDSTGTKNMTVQWT